MQTNRYIRAIIGLSNMVAILAIALVVLVCSSQPHQEQLAYAESPKLVETTPLFDQPAAPIKISVNPNSGLADLPEHEPELTPEQYVRSDARYMAAFLALGRYQGLLGTLELYEGLLSTLDVKIVDYPTLTDEIEAVTAKLIAAPDIWQQTADAVLAAHVLPA